MKTWMDLLAGWIETNIQHLAIYGNGEPPISLPTKEGLH